MATIDSANAHWSDGCVCRRNQHAARSSEFQRHNIFDMQDNLGSSEIHDDNLIVVENNTKSSTMPSVINPYHENEREAAAKQQSVHATDKDTNAIPLDCNSAVVSNLICDISNMQLTEPIVSDDIDVYKNTAIIAPSPTAAQKSSSNSKSTNAGKRCKKCNCVCDKNATDKFAQNAIRTNVDCRSDAGESGANANDVGDVGPAKATTLNLVQSDSEEGAAITTTTAATTATAAMCATKTTTASTPYQQHHHLAYLPLHFRNIPKTQSLDMADSESDLPGYLPKTQSFEQNRPIYPNVPYSPYGSPFGSPRMGRRRPPLRESRRISIEQTGSFLQLNQYKLMDQIGQGSYGLVKLAYSEEDSTHYAMKILSKRKLLRKAGLMGRGPKKGTSPLDRVYREIAVLKKLDHPNVVKLVEVLDDPLEDSLYLVFELVQLGEVLSVPTNKPLTEERAWSVFRDALMGLEYLHYQRIIHSDIKPDNLLLGECGRVKIADLGVCNEFLGEDASMNNGSTAGTPAFRAPETLQTGQHSYSGKAADIWALGATLYSLVYGIVPFSANNVPAVYEKIKHDGLNFPATITISDELRDLIEGMLDKDPNKRLTLPQIKEHAWVTSNNSHPLPSEEANCRLVQVNDDDINSVVKSIPKLDTLILIKTMLKKHSFQNPFTKGISGRAPQRGGSRLERFTRAGRSNSAPGAYHMIERQISSDNILPSVSEGVVSPCSESSNETDSIV